MPERPKTLGPCSFGRLRTCFAGATIGNSANEYSRFNGHRCVAFTAVAGANADNEDVAFDPPTASLTKQHSFHTFNFLRILHTVFIYGYFANLDGISG